MKIEVAPFMSYLALPLYLLDAISLLGSRSRYLRHLIKKRQPDIIHALETQHGGYLVADAVAGLTNIPEFRLTLWGSDLIWFRRFRRHQRLIRNVLTITDSLGIECKRDVDIARTLGFRGEFLPVLPASGAMDMANQEMSHTFDAPSTRKKIVVKGYSGFVGRSLSALDALEQLADELSEFEIHIYSASIKTVYYARRIAKRSKLRVLCHRKHTMTHEEVMSLFSKARVSLSLSLSDGFPGSLREAMVSGCFPIESKNSCGNDWTIPDRSAFFVDPKNRAEIIRAVKESLRNDSLVDTAAILNSELANSRFSAAALAPVIESYYFGKIQRGTTTS